MFYHNSRAWHDEGNNSQGVLAKSPFPLAQIRVALVSTQRVNAAQVAIAQLPRVEATTSSKRSYKDAVTGRNRLPRSDSSTFNKKKIGKTKTSLNSLPEKDVKKLIKEILFSQDELENSYDSQKSKQVTKAQPLDKSAKSKIEKSKTEQKPTLESYSDMESMVNSIPDREPHYPYRNSYIPAQMPYPSPNVVYSPFQLHVLDNHDNLIQTSYIGGNVFTLSGPYIQTPIKLKLGLMNHPSYFPPPFAHPPIHPPFYNNAGLPMIISMMQQSLALLQSTLMTPPPHMPYHIQH